MKHKATERAGRPRSWTGLVFLAACTLFTWTTYGGIRSPDNEVNFRAAESFASRLRLTVDGRLDSWSGFGVAPGRDGAQYPIFGPLQPVALAPFVLAARPLAGRWPESVPLPPSFYVGGGLASALYGAPLHDRPAHALRLLCASFNVLVSALCVTVFFLILGRLTGTRASAVVGAAFLGAGSLLWPYAGTYFSEPLAMLFVLLSFRWLASLVDRSESAGARPRGPRAADVTANSAPPAKHAGLAGFALGLAVAAHVTAALFIPFFAAIPWQLRSRFGPAGARRTILAYLAGIAAVLMLLGMYNWSRFGNPLETGRTAVPGAAEEFGYGNLTSPWPGIYGLLAAPGKGLFLFSPAAVLGLLAWPAFHRRHRMLSLTLGWALVVRWLFIGCRSDWHGGFCLGPRYLLPILPFLLLPLTVAIDDRITRGDRRFIPWIAGALVLCMAQQAAFCTGEIFSYLHNVRHQAERIGLDVFAGDRIYLDWRWSPLFRLLDGRRGPFLLSGAGLGNRELWLLLCLVLTAFAAAGAIVLWRRLGSTPASRRPA